VSETYAARVVVAYGGHGVVRLEDGHRLECAFRRGVGRPFCGDFVEVSVSASGQAAVESIVPRRNHFDRADAQLRRQTVAANLDRVLVVVAPNPAPSRDLLDRYLVAVHNLNMMPVIVFNKCELPVDGPDAPLNTLHRLPQYAELGYPVVRTSCKSEPGISALKPYVSEGTSILVGQSGVGKSSLARRLLPDMEIQIGALSRATGKGTHTTTTTTLYPLPEGGDLIDSPGVWEFGLWAMTRDDIMHGFPEFAPWLGQCRFHNCLHLREPGCAIKQAVADGALHDWRYGAYVRLQQSNGDRPEDGRAGRKPV